VLAKVADILLFNRSVYLQWFGQSIILIFCGMIGTIMYAYFHGCDPLATGKIGAADQVIYKVNPTFLIQHDDESDKIKF